MVSPISKDSLFDVAAELTATIAPASELKVKATKTNPIKRIESVHLRQLFFLSRATHAKSGPRDKLSQWYPEFISSTIVNLGHMLCAAIHDGNQAFV